MRRRSNILVLAAVLVASPDQAKAGGDGLEQARQLFARAETHFNLAEYSLALEAFKDTFRLHPDPALLFNIGVCHQKLQRPAEALPFFRAYLRRLPAAPNRAAVEDAIREIERSSSVPLPADPAPAIPVWLAPPATAVAAPTVVMPPPPTAGAGPERRSLAGRWWFWAGIAAIAAGGIAVVLAASSSPPAESAACAGVSPCKGID